MKKLVAFIILSTFLLIILTSCTGAKQLNERLIVQGLGIDYSFDKYTISVMYMDTSSETQQTKTLVTNGNSVVDAMTNSISETGKEPLYSQNLFILLGKGVIENGFDEALNFFAQYYESRQNVNIFATLEKAEDIIMQKDITPQQINDISGDTKRSGRAIISTLMTLENDLLSGYYAPKTTNLILSEETVKSDGTVVFKEDKVDYTISPVESLGVLLVSGNADTATEVTVEDNQNDFMLSNCDSNIEVNIENNNVTFDIKISANADVYKLHLEEDELENSIQNRIDDICNQAIEKCIIENKSDVFGFSNYLMNKDKEYYKSLENVLDTLSKATYNVETTISVN